MHGYSLSTYSILTRYLYNTYVGGYIQRFFSRVVRLMYSPPPIIETIVPISPDEKYIQTQTARFMRTFDAEHESIDYNTSIDPVFYSKKELSDLLKDELNTLEPKWRTKMLFEQTPRGNIVMFYDAFKQGFAYYTDQTGIPYSILNAVAMKYATTFRCRDFFVDEHVLPENTPSGITLRYAEEDRIEKDKKQAQAQAQAQNATTDTATIGVGVGSTTKNAFVKFKSYNSVSSKANGYTPKSSENMSAKSKEEQTIAPKLTNKHISLGKISNLSFIQKPIRKRLPTIESDLLPKPRLAYADFKRQAEDSLTLSLL